MARSHSVLAGEMVEIIKHLKCRGVNLGADGTTLDLPAGLPPASVELLRRVFIEYVVGSAAAVVVAHVWCAQV